MRLAAEEIAVLIGCKRRQDELAARKAPPAWQKWNVAEFNALREHGPKYGATWFAEEGGYVPEKVRVRHLRAVYRLADEGLIAVTKIGNRLAHVKLTAEGEQAVAALLNDAEKGAGTRRRPARGDRSIPPGPYPDGRPATPFLAHPTAGGSRPPTADHDDDDAAPVATDGAPETLPLIGQDGGYAPAE